MTLEQVQETSAVERSICGVKTRFADADAAMRHAIQSYVYDASAAEDLDPINVVSFTLPEAFFEGHQVDLIAQIPMPDLQEAFGALGCLVSRNEMTQRWEFLHMESRSAHRIRPQDMGHPPWETTAPYASVVNWAGGLAGYTLLHAGTVCSGGKAALLAGRGGSGKSGTVLGCVRHSMTTCGDDYVFVSGGNRITAHTAFRHMKQDMNGLTRVGLSDHPITNAPVNWQGKIVADFDAISCDGTPALVEKAEVKVVFLPHVANAPRTTVLAASPIELIRGTVPATVLQLFGQSKSIFDTVAAIGRVTPIYHLHLGTDPKEIADVIQQVLEDH